MTRLQLCLVWLAVAVASFVASACLTVLINSMLGV
jgi:hypothetical protein